MLGPSYFRMHPVADQMWHVERENETDQRDEEASGSRTMSLETEDARFRSEYDRYVVHQQGDRKASPTSRGLRRGIVRLPGSVGPSKYSTFVLGFRVRLPSHTEYA